MAEGNKVSSSPSVALHDGREQEVAQDNASSSTASSSSSNKKSNSSGNKEDNLVNDESMKEVPEKRNTEASSAKEKKQDPAASNIIPQKAASKSKKSSKKRSRQDAQERQLVLKMDRYYSLLHMGKKKLMKQAKQVRTFMVQRRIRKIKQQKPSPEQSGEEGELEALKELSMDLVVSYALKQLGLIHANPDPEATFESPPPLAPDQSRLVSSILDHKRFQAALEEWNGKVADFRRFCLSLDERSNPFAAPSEGGPSKKKKKKNATTTTSLRAPSHSHRQHGEDKSELPTSYFCSSLNIEHGDSGEFNEMMAYGPAAGMMGEEDFGKPKNRQGQRARKAKAMAIQAKKEGRQYQSLNWREEKKKSGDRDQSDTSKKSWPRQQNDSKTEHSPVDKPKINAPINSSTAETADAASHHPSWAAKQQQKSGIVAFQGKKITFD